MPDFTTGVVDDESRRDRKMRLPVPQRDKLEPARSGSDWRAE
mgnify:FL=1